MRPFFWKTLLAGLTLAAVTIYGYRIMTTPGWSTLSTEFMKADQPYGGGAFVLRGNEVMTLKLAHPVVTFKPRSERIVSDVAEPVEPWMKDTSELLNRSTANFLRSDVDGAMTNYFQQPAQGTAWWYSKDWSTIYVATDWMDYKIPEPENGLSPHIARLWRSGDGGKTWAQLNWPEDHNINDLLFLDSQRGYAIGWGPHVWRTADGGRSWQEIPPPPMATDASKPRKMFDAVDLGPDGTLRVAYYVPMLGKIQLSSVVYRLRWEAAQFEQDVVLPDQVVVQLGSTDEPPGYTYSIYALSQLGLPRDWNDWNDQNDEGVRTGAISTWANYQTPPVTQRHTFDERYTLEGLEIGKRGVLLVYASDDNRAGASHDITFYSSDFGKSWNDVDDGISQGGWFDRETNTQYALYAYTLKKRAF
ncbi:hypothetical protein LIG30_0486 [Burkholderia sp. lig30]|uniref:WD40/YVTN/BNR-like repeat-containing protein n=1 Tax=Burkholderia sp. lig30 TaxID=1192124 RepID=UPI000462004B|nr:glycosyl hydrolase [Burkholderia sp. lig30]KDB06212.1 hypothetical protein LIG30_0486 [Burkholderia sp. lig30]